MKIKNLLFATSIAIFAIGFGSLNSSAQTSVPGGTVSGHWTTGGSPYNIMGSINIPSGSTLIIDPGVSVVFQTSLKLKMIVSGQVLAVGTASQNIYITASDVTNGFGGIRFNTLASSNDTSKFIYCNIQYGKDNASPYDNGGAFYFYKWNKAIISHCTIENCTASGGTSNDGADGGAIYCSACSPIITYNLLSNNTSIGNWYYGGGAIYLENDTNAVISHNTIVYNSATVGGGIYCVNVMNAQFTYNTISNNSINNGYAAGGGGGGINCSSGTVTISNNTISKNNATMYDSDGGGGIVCTGGSITISNNIISNNYTNTDGGGISLFTCTNASISHNVISGNRARNGGGIGCSPYGQISTIDNNIFTNNSAITGTGLGGGIYLDGYNGGNAPSITNVTFANNKAINGGAVYCFNNCNPTFFNCIFWGDSATTLGSQVLLYDEPSDPNIYNCDVQGGQVSINPNGNFYTGIYNNNINANPLFVAPSTGTDSTNYYGVYNWTLQAASTCINTGDPIGSYPFTYPATDLAGAARVFGGNIDMGAYEYHHVSVTASHTDLACHGGNNATATANPAGYVPTCTYLWSNGQTTQTATGLSATTYTVTVTDGSSATASTTVTISQPAAIIANAGVNDTICFGGNTSIGGSPTASGGTGTLTYAWSNSTSLSSSIIANPIATPASTTTYTVTVTDGNSCAVTASVIITVIAHTGTAATPSGTTTLCQGSPNTTYTTAGASAATAYHWSIAPPTAGTISGTGVTGTITWNPAFSGPAQISVNGSNSCSGGTASNQLTVTVNPLPTVSINSIPAFIEYNSTPLALTGNPSGGTFTGTGVTANTFHPAVAGSAQRPPGSQRQS